MKIVLRQVLWRSRGNIISTNEVTNRNAGMKLLQPVNYPVKTIIALLYGVAPSDLCGKKFHWWQILLVKKNHRERRGIYLFRLWSLDFFVWASSISWNMELWSISSIPRKILNTFMSQPVSKFQARKSLIKEVKKEATRVELNKGTYHRHIYIVNEINKFFISRRSVISARFLL